MEGSGWQTSTDTTPNCPRCGASNTKFCYYNNYSLTQPRYFCKACRRYWTRGGNLRNVPVGGGCRKNRRTKSLRLSSTQRNSNNNNDDNDAVAGDSSSGHHASNIDLAVVYANFLNNPQPESNKVSSKSSDMVVTNDLHQETGNLGFFGWDSLSELFVDSSLKSGFEESLMNSAAPAGYFELPPLPGVGCEETMAAATAVTWSDSGHSLLVDQSLAAMELLPVINGSSNRKESEFSGDQNTFFRK